MLGENDNWEKEAGTESSEFNSLLFNKTFYSSFVSRIDADLQHGSFIHQQKVVSHITGIITF